MPNDNSGFARPVLAEVPLNPSQNDVPFRSKGRPDRQVRSLSSVSKIFKSWSI